MLSKNKLKKGLEIGVGMTVIAVLVSGCLGSSTSSSTSSAQSVAGFVADGYIGGAKVCLDVGNDGACDATDPSATTSADGSYLITGIPAASSVSAYPVIVEIPATATDTDLPSGSTVGQAYTLAAPAGKGAFVSPLTTLAKAKIDAGSSVTEAEAAIQSDLGVTTSVFDNYIAKTQTTAHQAAQVTAKVFRDSFAALGATPLDGATLKVLHDVAKGELATQKAKGTFDVAAVSGVASGITTKLADVRYDNLQVAGAATRTVSIDFGVLVANGAASAVLGADVCAKTVTLGANASGAAVAGQLQDLRFYISNVALVDHDGVHHPVLLDETDFQSKGVALLDFESSTATSTDTTIPNAVANKCTVGDVLTNTVIKGKVENGPHYHGIAFTLGVPVFSPGNGKTGLNHSDITAATTPKLLSSSAMNWSWQNGRKFTKIEFVGDTQVMAMDMMTNTSSMSYPKSLLHLGSQGCTVNPKTGGAIEAGYECAKPNRVQFTLDNGGFLNADGTSTQKVALDMITLTGGFDLSAAKMCMPCKQLTDPFKLDTTTGLPTATSSVFILK